MNVSATENFAEELSWCITQLELGLMHQSPDSKKVAETVKVLKILKSSKAPLVKKRQAMRNALGDYRKKMKDERAKTLSEWYRCLSCSKNNDWAVRGNNSRDSLRHSKFKAMDRIKMSNKSKFFKHSHSRQSHPVNTHLLTTLTNLNLSPLVGPAEEPASERSNSPSGSSDPSLHQRQQSCFKFIPSDNCFSFGFESDVAGVKQELDGDGLADKTDELATAENNAFRFQTSSNEFTFNFGSEDCGS